MALRTRSFPLTAAPVDLSRGLYKRQRYDLELTKDCGRYW